MTVQEAAQERRQRRIEHPVGVHSRQREREIGRAVGQVRGQVVAATVGLEGDGELRKWALDVDHEIAVEVRGPGGGRAPIGLQCGQDRAQAGPARGDVQAGRLGRRHADPGGENILKQRMAREAGAAGPRAGHQQLQIGRRVGRHGDPFDRDGVERNARGPGRADASDAQRAGRRDPVARVEENRRSGAASGERSRGVGALERQPPGRKIELDVDVLQLETADRDRSAARAGRSTHARRRRIEAGRPPGVRHRPEGVGRPDRTGRADRQAPLSPRDEGVVDDDSPRQRVHLDGGFETCRHDHHLPVGPGDPQVVERDRDRPPERQLPDGRPAEMAAPDRERSAARRRGARQGGARDRPPHDQRNRHRKRERAENQRDQNPADPADPICASRRRAIDRASRFFGHGLRSPDPSPPG